MDITFNSFPLEIQMQVCSYLSTSELHQLFAPVCKTWKHLASQFMLRRDVTLDGEIHSIANMVQNLQKSYKVRNLTLYRILSWHVLANTLPRCNYLRRMEFLSCKITAKYLKKLAARFPSIESVKIVFNAGQFNNRVVHQLADWKLLKDISIDTGNKHDICDYIGSKIVEFFAVKCEHLIGFELLGHKIFLEAFVTLIQFHGSTLEKLSVQFYLSLRRSDHVIIRRSFKICRNLKILHISGVDGIVRLKQNKLLQDLQISDNLFLSFTFRGVIFSHLHKLEITDSYLSFKSICLSCPSLKIFTIRLIGIDDEGITHITMSLKHLQRLTLDFCPQITSKLLSSITLNDSNLVYLECTNCCRFVPTDRDLLEARRANPTLQIYYKQWIVQK